MDSRYRKKLDKISNDSTKHYPNKDEASLLRKIMANTGLSEQEVRSEYKYRKMLSDAQKEGQKRKYSDSEKFYHSCIGEACGKTGLAKEHPKTIEVLDLVIEKYYDNHWWGIPIGHNKLSAKRAVELYGRSYKNK